MTEQELKAQIAVVAETRKQALAITVALNAGRSQVLSQWEEQNHIALVQAKLAGETRDAAEAKLRAMTLEAYLETGNKAPAPGIGIRILTKLDYKTETAFEWAVNHRLALKLDVPAFEKIAKASPLEFVSLREEPQATIATVLPEVAE